MRTKSPLSFFISLTFSKNTSLKLGLSKSNLRFPIAVTFVFSLKVENRRYEEKSRFASCDRLEKSCPNDSRRLQAKDGTSRDGNHRKNRKS